MTNPILDLHEKLGVPWNHIGRSLGIHASNARHLSKLSPMRMRGIKLITYLRAKDCYNIDLRDYVAQDDLRAP